MSTDIVSYDKQWAKEAAASAAAEPLTAGGRVISHRSGIFHIGDDLEFPELCVVVLASAYENTYFKNPFDPDHFEPPTCFALQDSDEDGALAPHPVVFADDGEDWFVPQSEKCYGCKRNEWPKKGEVKRKECRNMRRLLVLPVGQYTKRKGSRDLDLDMFLTDDMDQNAELVAEGDVYLLKIPPTALRGYKEMVHDLNREYSRPVHGMILRIYTEALRSGGHTVRFEPLGTLPDALYTAIKERREAEKDTLLRPYTAPDE